MQFYLFAGEPYNFAASVQDYGWIELAPSEWVEQDRIFRRIERLSTGKVVETQVAVVRSNHLSGSGSGGSDHFNSGSASGVVPLLCRVKSAESLSQSEQGELKAALNWMLRLDEDLEPFYRRAKDSSRLWSQVKSGRGRLLRSPSLFEDVVKTICTTNTTWRQTKEMVARLVSLLGSPYPLDTAFHAFPTPDQIAAAGPAILQQEVRLGYRGNYVHRLALEVASGERDLAKLQNGGLSITELKKELKSIKGVGDYSANNLLMLLGHYGHLALDSEMRAFVSKRYFDGGSAADADIVSIYDSWGEWRYLAYWFDLIA